MNNSNLILKKKKKNITYTVNNRIILYMFYMHTKIFSQKILNSLK